MKQMLTLLVSFLIALPLSAQDVSGKWTWRPGTGYDDDILIHSMTFDFKKDGKIESHIIFTDDEQDWGTATISYYLTGTYKQNGKGLNIIFNFNTANFRVESFDFNNAFKQKSKDPQFINKITAEVLDEWADELKEEGDEDDSWKSTVILSHSPKKMVLVNSDKEQFEFVKD
ncbi:MAG: hypothetical protein K6F94_00495 [Bacteroidaceae bacterium]|nr:hypothetical protein [Bacteroidaceae bacterium]